MKVKALKILIAYLLCELIFYLCIENHEIIVVMFYIGLIYIGTLIYKLEDIIIRRIKNGKHKN